MYVITYISVGNNINKLVKNKYSVISFMNIN